MQCAVLWTYRTITSYASNGDWGIISQQAVIMIQDYPSSRSQKRSTITMVWSSRHPTAQSEHLKLPTRYAYSSTSKICIGQRGNIAYLTYDMISLLRIETDCKSHYIYIKSTDHLSTYTRILTIRTSYVAQSVQRRSGSTSSDHTSASATTLIPTQH